MNKIKSNTAVVCLSTNFGGMELDTIKIAQKLSPYMKIVLVTKANGFTEKNFTSYFENSDVSLESISFKSSLSINIVKKMKDIVKKYEIKNVIYFGASELKSLYFAFLGFDINLIVRHGTTKSTPKKDFFHKLVYSKVNYHIAISKHIQNNVRKIIPFGKNSKEVLIYPSIQAFDYEKTSNDKLTIVHTGRITKGKGQIDAIKACEILLDNNIDFIFYIVGGYENNQEKDRFLDVYNQLPYKDKIKLVGFTKDVDFYLQMADIYLFPSYGEGFGNSFVEALYSKAVCISYENTTFIEFKNLGFDFEMVENKNIEKLKNSLFKVAKKELNFDVNKNRKIVEDIFSKSSEINRYLDILV